MTSVVQVPVSIHQDNIIHPTELTFPNGGFCNVRAVILTFEVCYMFETEDFVAIVNCSQSFSPCVLSDGVEYSLQEFGNITLPACIMVLDFMYWVYISQMCPSGTWYEIPIM